MKTPQNYYIYAYHGKLHRQAINPREIYPEGYALTRIPADAEIVAKLWGGRGVWMKHALMGSGQMRRNWTIRQVYTEARFYPLLTQDEQSRLTRDWIALWLAGRFREAVRAYEVVDRCDPYSTWC